jgi:ESCRT-I complex subunit TSG101
MVIKQNHKHVDPNGECNVPYIQFWNTSSNLFELVAEMCNVFSKDPPLFAKSTQLSTVHASYKNSKPLPPPPSSQHPPNNTPTTYTPPAYTSQLSPPAVRLTPSLTPTLTPQQLQQQQQQQQQQALEALKQQVTKKLQQKLDEFFKNTTKDMEMFMSNQSTLEQRNGELAKSSEALKIEESELDKANAAAVAKNEEMANWITFLEQPREVDELVLPSDPISQQLFTVVTEDHAIDDVLYYLGKGLAAGKIDLDTYLKEVRSLSRQQFFLRALAMKLSAMQEERKR